MNIFEKKKNMSKQMKQEKDKKNIGKRYLINYNDIIPSFNRIAKEEDVEVINQTVLEYCGKGIYIDLLTNNIVADNYKYNISEKIDFQFDLFDVSKYLKQISKKESESFLERITEDQKEMTSIIILKARISALKNALQQLKKNNEEENKVKSLQK